MMSVLPQISDQPFLSCVPLYPLPPHVPCWPGWPVVPSLPPADLLRRQIMDLDHQITSLEGLRASLRRRLAESLNRPPVSLPPIISRPTTVSPALADVLRLIQ